MVRHDWLLGYGVEKLPIKGARDKSLLHTSNTTNQTYIYSLIVLDSNLNLSIFKLLPSLTSRTIRRPTPPSCRHPNKPQN